MKLQRPKGTADLLPKETAKWQYIESLARSVFEDYNFQEIRTPMFESYELFSRATGETSDIVTKEMYDFMDKGDRHIALRPEGTASTVRAYVENKLFAPEIPKPVKMYYIGSMFRYERPQSGRLREFHQLGVECFGMKNPAVDVEIMAMAQNFFETVGIQGVTLHLNSLGDSESRAAYHQALLDYLTPFEAELSEDSKRRLHENPLRILDSKEPEDKAIVENAPSILDYLNDSSQAYFTAVREQLDALGIAYEIDTNMVRGLDYYNDTIFEFIVKVGRSELTVCAGGRYDGLVEYFDGPETPAFGFGLGLERLIMIAEQQEVEFMVEDNLDVYVAVLGEAASLFASKVTEELRQNSYKADRDFSNRKLNKQFASAEKLNAQFIITLGDEEAKSERFKIKNSETREEFASSLATLADDMNKLYQEIYGA